MHHALMIARRLLSRHRHGQRQVLMRTDGEPTAHLEQGMPYFNYPPSWRTIEQTLLEVERCTKEGVIINTFMMEQDPYLMRFIQDLSKRLPKLIAVGPFSPHSTIWASIS